jgi:Vanillate O-demethylase oxygenase C-terminal domain
VVASAALALAGQDQVVVESQRPERVPFDLAAELHLKFDTVAVAYREAMRQSGLATTDAIGHLAGTHSS